MKRLLPGEYVYRDEVFPILVVAVAFNLAGSFLVEMAKAQYVVPGASGSYLSFALLFQDTTGTAFAALALGPWWGALVGVVSSTLNTFWLSEHFGDAFAYTSVNVGLALAWGYVGRAVYAEAVLIAPESRILTRRALFAVFTLVLAGAVVATIMADLIKVSLLEKAGGNLFQGPNEPIYAAIQEHLQLAGLRAGTRELALGIFDFYANAVDKGLSLIIALGLLKIMGVIPSARSLGDRTMPVSLGQRMKVGADSIISFAVLFAIYLLISRLVLQHVRFTHSPIGAGLENWMKPLGAQLLLPFIIGYVVFVFGTLAFSREADAQVEAKRLQRSELYNRIRMPNPWSRSGLERSQFFFVQQNSGYGVIFSLLTWPAKNYLPDAKAVWIYFFAMLGASLLFFLERRESLGLFRKAQEWREDLNRQLIGGEANTASLIPLLRDIVEDLDARSGIRRAGRMSYQIAINGAKSGWLHDMRNFKGIDNLVLLAREEEERLGAVWSFLKKMNEETGVSGAIVLLRALNEQQIRQLHTMTRTANYLLIVLEFADMEELIEARAQKKDAGIVLAGARVQTRFLRMLEAADAALPDLLARRQASAGIPATATAMAGASAGPDKLALCEFTMTEVPETELGISEVSGKRYRVDEQSRSAISGKTGHQKEFVICEETGQPLLREEAERCELTGRLVMPGLLEQCAITKKTVLPSELERCAATGKKALRKLFVTSSVSGARILEEAAVQSIAGKFCAPREAKLCIWSGRNWHPDDVRRCSLTGVPIHVEFATYDPKPGLQPLMDLLQGIRRTTDEPEIWSNIASKAGVTLRHGRCRVKTAIIAPDRRHLAVCLEVRDALGLRVRQAGLLYSIAEDFIVGRIASGKRP